jgi:hypothetical protein
MDPNQMLGLLFIFVGAGAWAYVGYLKMKVQKSMSWPSTQGEILQSEVIQKESGGYSATSTVYKAKILYRYQVQHRKYKSDKLSIGQSVNTGSKDRAETTVRQYPVGATVDVYYNPENPKDVCLERKEEMIIMAWIMSLFIFFGLGMVTGLISMVK